MSKRFVPPISWLVAVCVAVVALWIRHKQRSDADVATETTGVSPEASSEPPLEKPAGPDPKYRALTKEILAATPDDQLEQAIVDQVDRTAGDESEVRKLPIGVRAIYTTWWLDAEVNNGGFNQYFWNDTGVFAEEALAGLRLIGANDRAKLLEEAIRIHGEQRARMDELKQKGTLEAFSESYKDNELSALDTKFFKLEEDGSKLRIAYIRKHPEKFLSGP